MSDDVGNPGSIRWQLALLLLVSWVIVFLVLLKGIDSLGKVRYLTVIDLIWMSGPRFTAKGPDREGGGTRVLDRGPLTHISSIIYLLHLCVVSCTL